MTRRVAVVGFVAGLLALPATAAAQPAGTISVAFGATTYREDPPGDFAGAVTYDTGWALHASYTFLWNQRLGPAFDIGGNRRQNIVGERQTLDAWLVGARVDLVRARRFTAFAHALAGRETFEEPGFTETGFAIQPGGGVDVGLWKGIGARAQADYRIVKYDGDDGRYRNWRVFIGGVVTLTRQ